MRASEKKDQLDDTEIKQIIELQELSDEKPSWQDIASFHPTTKRHWALWDSFHLRNGVFNRKWQFDDGKTFSRTIQNSRSLLVSSNQQDKKLPLFLIAYKSAVLETTGYSPSQMFFGRNLRLPAYLLFNRPPDAPLAHEKYIEKLQA
ncbi:retrovirus-related Pol polyprotein from transposon 412 [Trichonephila clavipes]|nr:retrovirus-related Pol polyprotein from transposon 412 [Trichonephila clavipes]